MLVRSILMLLGSLGAVVTDLSKNGASTPTRGTEAADGSASPRKSVNRQRSGSDAELEDAGRLAHQRSRGVSYSESQAYGGDSTLSRRFLSESELEEARKIAYQQKLRSASHPEIHFHEDGHRGGSASPSRSISESELEDARRKALLPRSEQHLSSTSHSQAHQADGYASDTDDHSKRAQSLSASPSWERQNSQNRKRFLEFSTPKVFQSVCNYEKFKTNDPTLNDACHTQCIELSNLIEDIYKNYPHMVKIETLHSECSGFTKGICRKTFDYKGKRIAACSCLEWTNKDNFRSQYAAICRAALSGLKVITNIGVATEGIRKSYLKWRAQTKNSRKSKKCTDSEVPKN